MRPTRFVIQDTTTIRGILDLFENDSTVTVNDVAMTQHVSRETALRLMRRLADAGVIERPTKEAEVLGVKQKAPCIGWQLTTSAKKGEIQSVEELAGGIV